MFKYISKVVPRVVQWRVNLTSPNVVTKRGWFHLRIATQSSATADGLKAQSVNNIHAILGMCGSRKLWGMESKTDLLGNLGC